MGTIAWSPVAEQVIVWLVPIAVFFFVLRWLHRRGMRRGLRDKLLDAGVAVCVHCGYLLRGLPLDPGRCPECGRAFGDRARRILERDYE